MNWNIYKNGVLINTIHATEKFVKKLCADNGYTYKLRPEPESQESVPEDAPTQLDRIESQMAYTAMMTDTLLEV